MRLLVRTWNVFHGHSVPETGRTHLREMVALVARDEPDLVCLQEVPVWALPQLEEWSGMASLGAIAIRPIGGRLARPITAIDPRRLRSALTGQANAVLVSRRLSVVGAPATLVLNPRDVRRREAKRRGFPMATRVAWGRNRRLAQLVRVSVGEVSAVIVNLHLSSLPDSRPADAELLRTATYAESFAQPAEPIVLAGDLNLTVGSSVTLRALAGWGFSAPPKGIDHILVRGLSIARGPEAWPAERRRLGDVLLSDHAPIEVEMIGA